MLAETLEELGTSIDKAHESLKRDLAKIRAGRANPGILDGLRIDYYGTPTPLKQLASISVPEARMIVLKPFDRTQMQPIEKAIMEAQPASTRPTTVRSFGFRCRPSRRSAAKIW
jgi:ribosome recycling factor